MFGSVNHHIKLNSDIKNKLINTEKWNEELDKIKVSRQEMNKLVLNFLIIEGYKDAVHKFVKETGIKQNTKILKTSAA